MPVSWFQIPCVRPSQDDRSTAGKRAGMKVCAVQDAYSMDVDAEKHGMADYYIDHYEQILEKDGL